MKYTVVAQILVLLFSKVKAVYKIWQKLGWATIWAIFSKANLVTLLEIEKRRSVVDRVTRVGEFSPNGRPFSLGHFFENTKLAQILQLHMYSALKTYVLILTKYGLGYILGDIFSLTH
jgi:hypothetical protein